MDYREEQLQIMSDDEIFDALGDKYNCYIRRSALFEDIMSIAFDRKLSIIECVGEYVCTNDAYSYHHSSAEDFYANGGIRYIHVKPLIAVACCLLLMESV